MSAQSALSMGTTAPARLPHAAQQSRSGCQAGMQLGNFAFPAHPMQRRAACHTPTTLRLTHTCFRHSRRQNRQNVAVGAGNAEKSEGQYLQGKVALITGGSGGIGSCIAKRFASKGATLALVGKEAKECEEIAEDCRKEGAKSADPWGVNLTDPKALDDFAKQVLHKYGTVDILVNCAGIIPKSEGVGDGDVSEWSMALNINLLAPMALTNAFAPKMQEQKEGAIFNLASIAGVTAIDSQPVYACSKAGLRSWSTNTHSALRKDNIKVVCINPAVVATPMTEGRECKSELMLRPDDITDAIMYALTCSPNCVPEDIVLRLVLPADKR